MEFLYEGLLAITWQQVVMYLVGGLLIWLAIEKEYEPSLLLPMGFGAILVNLPMSGVIDQITQGVGETNGIIQWLFEAGIENIRVWKRPSAAILATGHEIAEAGALSSAGRHSSNAVYLMNLLSGLGLTDTAIFYAKDEADSIADRLEVLAQSFDFIITVGGTGQGKSDMLRLALKRAGAKQSEDQTKLSSSLPFVCANLKGAVLFGLPGNPLGFVNIVQRVVLPVIWQSFRTDPFFVRRQKVFMGFDYEGKAGDICVQLAPFEGRVIALPVQKGSGRSSAFRDAAAAIPNPQGRRIEAGEAVEAQLFFNGLLS